MKRTFRARCAALLVAAGAGAISASLAAQTAPTPVPVRSEPVTETIHGITLTDEYRWMEDPANASEMLAFVEAENARARAMLDALPERAWFAGRLGTISSGLDRVSGYMQCGDKAVFRRIGTGDRLPKLYIRDAAGERMLLDPAVVGGDPLSSFGGIEFSPDCRRLSVQVSSAGSEVGSVHLFDIASSREIGPPIPRMWGEGSVSFVGKDQLIYSQLAANPDGDAAKGVTAYIAAIDGSTATAVLGNGMLVAPEQFPVLIAADHEPFALGGGVGARVDNEFYLTTTASLLAGKPQWRQVVTLADRVTIALPRGKALYAMTTRDNSAGSILRHTLADDGTPGAGEVVFARSPEQLVRDMRVTRDGVYVHTTRDGAAQLFFLPDGRGPAQEVALPFEGSIFSLTPDADGRGVSFGLTGWVNGLTAFHVAGGKLTAPGLATGVWAGAADMAVTRMEAVSKDGTRVPMVAIRRKGAAGRTPTIIEAYGGYGVDTAAPFYARNAMVWLDKGGAQAYCGTRGGGERGRDWHEGGRGPNKPRAMEDLAACARTLTQAGIAPAHGPLITGGSMGGTLVPTAALSDPTAFGGQITSVGVVNASRIAFADNGANQFDEMGDPADPQQFRSLVAMDAYQMIPASAVPPVPGLMVIGLNDRRVAPWMTAKWVARARAKWPDAPIYLRGETQAGHGVGTAEDVRLNEAADLFAFAWAQQSR
jgi:prolyl oligopeptidase